MEPWNWKRCPFLVNRTLVDLTTVAGNRREPIRYKACKLVSWMIQPNDYCNYEFCYGVGDTRECGDHKRVRMKEALARYYGTGINGTGIKRTYLIKRQVLEPEEPPLSPLEQRLKNMGLKPFTEEGFKVHMQAVGRDMAADGLEVGDSECFDMAEGLLFDPRIREFVYRTYGPELNEQVAKEIVAEHIPETTREVTDNGA